MLICTHLWNSSKLLLTERIDSLSPHRETADCIGILYILTCLLAPRHYREVGSLEIHEKVVISTFKSVLKQVTNLWFPPLFPFVQGGKSCFLTTVCSIPIKKNNYILVYNKNVFKCTVELALGEVSIQKKHRLISFACHHGIRQS
jgi:hypothetical protein